MATSPGRRARRNSATRCSRSTTSRSSPSQAGAAARSAGGCSSAIGAGARAAAERLAGIFGEDGFCIELSHHLLPDDDWLVAESAALAADLRLAVVVTNAVHYAKAEDREFHDVLTAIKHGRTLDTLADLRRPDAESYLKSGEALAALGRSMDPVAARAWREGIERSVAIAAACDVDLGFEQYRFPGFPVPDGETPFSYLSELCWSGARNRYHPLTPAVVKRLANELDVIERAGLAEFFLICWDLMRFAKEEGIPAQGRGSATSSIVSYTLGISRVEPIAHNLLFERFINPGRTTYPDVDIDFSSARREEVIQYIYRRYGPEHTGMVCNLVTYRARSAVREVGYALGFPRPLVDRVAKALETYDSVMVRRDLEADGGFAEFFRRAGEGTPAEALAAARAEAHGLVDGMGQLQQRVPLVGKVPPWRQPPKPEDPNAPRPFAWLREGAERGGGPTTPTGVEGLPSTQPVRGMAGSSEDSSQLRTPRVVDANLSASHAQTAPETVPSGDGTASTTHAMRIWQESTSQTPNRARIGSHRWPSCGAAGRPTTKAARATRRRAWPGSGRVAGRGTGSSGRRPARSRWILTMACRCRPRARRTASVGRRCGTRRRPRRTRARSRGSSPNRPRRPVAVPRSACPTGSAGSSSAPGSTASRATCRSTRAACS